MIAQGICLTTFKLSLTQITCLFSNSDKRLGQLDVWVNFHTGLYTSLYGNLLLFSWSRLVWNFRQFHTIYTHIACMENSRNLRFVLLFSWSKISDSILKCSMLQQCTVDYCWFVLSYYLFVFFGVYVLAYCCSTNPFFHYDGIARVALIVVIWLWLWLQQWFCNFLRSVEVCLKQPARPCLCNRNIIFVLFRFRIGPHWLHSIYCHNIGIKAVVLKLLILA